MLTEWSFGWSATYPTSVSVKTSSLFAVEDHHTKPMSTSIPTQKSSTFRPPRKNQANCDPYAEIRLSSIPQIKIKSLSRLTLKPSDMPPASKIQVNFDHPHKTEPIDHHTISKSVLARTESISTPRARTSQLRTQHLNKVNVRSLAQKFKLISTPPLKSRQSDPHSKRKSASIPRRKNQEKFDPNTKTKYFSTPTQKQVISDPLTEIK